MSNEQENNTTVETIVETRHALSLQPALRFPEFQDSGAWEVKTLGEILVESRLGGNYENSDANTGIPVIKMGNLDRGSINLQKVQFLPKDYEYQNDDILEINDLLLNTRNTLELVGKVAIWKNELPTALYNSNLLRMTFHKDFIASNIFMNYCFNNQTTISSIRNIATGTTSVAAIYTKDLLKLKVAIPSLPEQRKIADCLSSLDALITAEGEKLQALKAHKKGLMQNLFPAEGETVPRLRFPEFQDSGEWEVREVGDIYDFKVTNSFSRENLNYVTGDVKNIHYGDIHTKFSTLFDISKEEVPYINLDVPINKIKAECYCVEGDIIFADASEDLNDVGKSIEIVNLNNEKLVSGLHTLLARQKEKRLIIGFGGYLFKSNPIRKQIQRKSQGAKVLGISVGRISNVIISFPQNPAEQQKIAACLSSLDALMTAQGEKIALLKQHKKGLMQVLFP